MTKEAAPALSLLALLTAFGCTSEVNDAGDNTDALPQEPATTTDAQVDPSSASGGDSPSPVTTPGSGGDLGSGGAGGGADTSAGSGGDPVVEPDEGFQTLNFLASIAGKQIVSGQHNDQKDGTDENHYTERVHEITGKYPGLYGADFLFHDSSDMRWAITYEAERQWEAGAIINIMWHACPPTQGSSCQWDGGLLSAMSDNDWNDLVTEGGELNGVWKSRMDDIAVYLQYLEDKGVEVMFRPLHEQNQGAFWWGGRTGDNGTKRLFRLTHDYMTLDKGLSNLIWVWDVQDLSTNYGDYNPGADYFDIAALDIYSDAYSNNTYHDALLAQAGDAPVAIGECFGLPPAWALDNQPSWTFFMNWAYGLEVDWNNNPTNSIEFIREVYDNPRVLTLDEMPGWK